MDRRFWMGSIAVLLLAFCVFQIKFKVQELRRELLAVHRDTLKEKEALHVLEAEWAYLNQPERLQKLVAEHLQVQYLSSAQIRGVDAIPYTTEHMAMLERAGEERKAE